MKKTIATALSALVLTTGIAVADAPREMMRGGFERMLGAADADGDGAVTDAEIDALRAEAFTSMDLDGDGILSDDEIEAARQAAIEAMRNVMALAPVVGPEFMMNFLSERPDPDTNGDGQIDESEFVEARGRGFTRIDENGDGDVSAEEIERVRDHMRDRRGPHRGDMRRH
ncbi:MAG: hypothetical protein AAFX39_11385 [Pseudomonadota bacterium]